MLKNPYLLAKIGADTAENERNFAENLPRIGNYPTGPLPYGSSTRGSPTAGRGAAHGLRLARRAVRHADRRDRAALHVSGRRRARKVRARSRKRNAPQLRLQPVILVFNY